MERYIYKFMSFPAFVDMVQRKALHFVLPSEWEDTEETSFVYEWAGGLDSAINKYMALILVNRTYAQSWTWLDESDAMWRIYSFDNQSLRIKVDVSSINQLNGVKMIRVEYSDSLIPYPKAELSHSEMLMKYIAQKRKAFEHEKEVRLLYLDKIQEEKIEPSIRNVYYFLKGKTGNIEDVDIDKINLDEFKEYVEYSNICGERRTHEVSFESISGFIKGVMVHPLAPDWYVNTVKSYCELNNIPFEGKSDLYIM